MLSYKNGKLVTKNVKLQKMSNYKKFYFKTSQLLQKMSSYKKCQVTKSQVQNIHFIVQGS